MELDAVEIYSPPVTRSAKLKALKIMEVKSFMLVIYVFDFKLFVMYYLIVKR